jgi:thiol-disulfide isomerase/thioredoxin
MGREHQHVQFGTGTVNFLGAVEVRRGFGGWGAAAWALSQQTVYENPKGYQAGDRYAAGLAATSPLGTKSWQFRLGAEVQGETAERWGGVTHTDDGNQGRVDVLASAGASVGIGGGWSLRANVRVPVYTHVVGGQLEYPLVASLGIATELALFGGQAKPIAHVHDDDHAHDHEHDRVDVKIDWSDVDMVHAADAGEAIELTGVAGKLTVYDFWAPWCEPCKDLDLELVGLGRKYPGLAIRKVNVVDWDSAAAKRWLLPGKYDLPHVKVVAADGTVLLERSGTPETLGAEIERLLRR